MRQSLYRDKLTVPGFARVEVVETSPSTNAELVTAVRSDPAGWPAPSALVAEHQTAGKGRAGRSWETPARAGACRRTPPPPWRRAERVRATVPQP